MGIRTSSYHEGWGSIVLKFEDRLSCTRPRSQEDLNAFKTVIEYRVRLREKLEDGDIT